MEPVVTEAAVRQKRGVVEEGLESVGCKEDRSPCCGPVVTRILIAWGPTPTAQAQESARLARASMSRAVEELNYRGTFVHVLDGTAEMLHIVHRHADGQSGERILGLDGAGREIVSGEGARVQGIFPDRAHRVVRDAQRRQSARLGSTELAHRARAALRACAAR